MVRSRYGEAECYALHQPVATNTYLYPMALGARTHGCTFSLLKRSSDRDHPV